MVGDIIEICPRRIPVDGVIKLCLSIDESAFSGEKKHTGRKNVGDSVTGTINTTFRATATRPSADRRACGNVERHHRADCSALRQGSGRFCTEMIFSLLWATFFIWTSLG